MAPADGAAPMALNNVIMAVPPRCEKTSTQVNPLPVNVGVFGTSGSEALYTDASTKALADGVIEAVVYEVAAVLLPPAVRFVGDKAAKAGWRLTSHNSSGITHLIVARMSHGHQSAQPRLTRCRVPAMPQSGTAFRRHS